MRSGSCALDLQGDGRRLVGVQEEVLQRLPHEQRRGRTAAVGPLELDAADDLGVQAEAGAEGEPALVGATEADRAAPVLAQRVQQRAGRVDRGRRQAERAGEDVGVAARHDGERRQALARPVAQQPVDDLVDGAVAAEGDDDVEAVVGGLPGERDGVPAGLRLDDVELDLAGQRVGQHVAHPLRRRRGLGVDDQQRAHGSRVDATSVPAVSRPVLRAAVLVAVEAVALVVLGLVYLLDTLRGGAETVVGALVGAALLVLGGVLLLLVARGLRDVRDPARAPAIAVQLLLALTGLSFLTVLPVAAVAALLLAGGVLQALASREGRAAFARE